MTVCFHHVAYAFQSVATVYSCLNVNERFARNSRHIWRLIGLKATQTQHLLFRKQTLNFLA